MVRPLLLYSHPNPDPNPNPNPNPTPTPNRYVVHTLLVGLKEAIASEGNPKVATMLTQVRHATAARVRVRAGLGLGLGFRPKLPNYQVPEITLPEA